jgi:hypothetical protein
MPARILTIDSLSMMRPRRYTVDSLFDFATSSVAMGDAIVKSVVIAGALIGFFASIALGQSADDLAALRRDINALKEGQTAVLRELQQIRTLLSQAPAAARPAAPQEAVVSLREGPSKGNKDAKVTLVEFTDYQ